MTYTVCSTAEVIPSYTLTPTPPPHLLWASASLKLQLQRVHIKREGNESVKRESEHLDADAMQYGKRELIDNWKYGCSQFGTNTIL